MAAWCVHLSKTNGWLLDPEREIAEGVRLARRAVAVGKDDPTALWSGGHSLAYLAAEVETGAAYIDRAIVLNPNLAAAWSVSGWLRIYRGNLAQSETLCTWRSSLRGTWEVSSMPGLVCRAGSGRRQAARRACTWMRSRMRP